MSLLVVRRIKKTVAENYDIISWILCVFLGGTMNIGILNAAYGYIMYYWSTLPVPNPPVPTLYHYALLMGYVIAVAILPFILSLILTAIQSELRIVPPFYITLISAAWMLVLWVNTSNVSTQLAPTLTLGMFYVTLGYGEDYATTYILGKAVERESIYYEHLRVYADIEDVKARFMVPEIAQSTHLSERVEGNAEQGYLFKTKSGPIFKNDIWINRDKDFPEVTSIKIVYYEVGRYNLRVSPRFIEEAHKMSRYLEDVFIYHEPKMGVEIIVPFTNKAFDRSIDRILDEMRGYYTRSKQFSTTDKFKIALLVGILILTGILFAIEQPTYAILSIAIEVLIAVLGLPDIIRKQRE